MRNRNSRLLETSRKPLSGTQRGIAPLALLTAIGVIVLVAVVGAAAYVIVSPMISVVTHPQEETAKFVSNDVDLYVSLNLTPGGSALDRVRNMIDLYRARPRFEDRFDELRDLVKDKTGLDLEEDVLSWLGPEVSVAVWLGQGGFTEEPRVLGFVGTRDSEASQDALDDLMRVIEREEYIRFRSRDYRGVTIYSSDDEDVPLHFAVTEDYVLFANDDDDIRDAIRMMEEPRNPLREAEEFKALQKALPDDRFVLAYANTSNALRAAEQEAYGEERDVLRDFADQLPEVFGLAFSVFEKGGRLDLYYSTPAIVPAVLEVNPVQGAKLLPQGVLTTVSLGDIRTVWKEARDALEESDLTREAFLEAMDEIERELGLRVDRDIFGWMGGEVTVALLPSDLKQGRYGGVEGSPALVGLIGIADKGGAERALGRIAGWLEDQGVYLGKGRIGSFDGWLVEEPLGDEDGLLFRPGYLFLDDFLVVGSSEEALRQVIDARDGKVDKLSEMKEFSRLREAAPSDTNFLIYGNIRDITELILDVSDPYTQADYQEEASLFLDPLESVLFAISANEERSILTLMVTVR